MSKLMFIQGWHPSRIIEGMSSQQNNQHQKFSCTRSLKVSYWSTRFNGAIIVGTSSDEAEFLASWFSHTACLDVSFEATRLFQTHIAAGRFSLVWFFPVWFSFRFFCRFFQHRVSWCAFYCCRKKLNKSPPDFLTPDGAGRAHNFPMYDW